MYVDTCCVLCDAACAAIAVFGYPRSSTDEFSAAPIPLRLRNVLAASRRSARHDCTSSALSLVLQCGDASVLRHTSSAKSKRSSSFYKARECGRDPSIGLRSSYSLPLRLRPAKERFRAVLIVGWLPKPESSAQQERIRRRKNTRTVRHRRGPARHHGREHPPPERVHERR